VRWIHPQLGMVSPGQFIPLAEETGLIVPIGEWILREACRQNKVWRDAGLPPIRVSVNLSPVQFRDPELYQVIRNALDEHELAHDGLELEVTESMLMNDPKATTRTLRKLKSAGLHISIDDFGTGYSSLSYLKQFPIDALKIDRSFVSEVTTNADDAAIATAIILMGHSLKLSVVAEGVETESQLAFLRVLQCNEVQGFLISPPVPAEQARELLRADGAQRQAG
jgi:EAL domain-containing protein (putative c-di-GMP-specific phosphodiesterase class I)